MSELHFFIGMDLGTYKTSVVSSTGLREVLPTAVGRPKDSIARNMLKSDVVFGDEIARHRMALNIIRPLAKGALKYVSSDEAGIAADRLDEYTRSIALLVQHAVARMNPPAGVRILGAIGAPSRAARESKKFLLDAAHAAMDAVMVVHEPFAVAYGMNRIDRALVIDIGAGTTDICPMYGSYTAEEDQLTLPLGGDHIDQKIIDRVVRDHPTVHLSDHLARQLKEKHGTVRAPGDAAYWEVTDAYTTHTLDLTGAIVDACQLIVEPLVRGVREVVARFDPDLQRTLLENIILAGGGSQLVGLDVAIERQLQPLGRCQVSRVSDAVFAGATGALKLAMNMPAEQWTRLGQSAQRSAA